uniref:Uncharacterized protein n=1 Tax=Meloidogyne incognita TaxID=6306 RepID=A0A914L4D6_MELIC
MHPGEGSGSQPRGMHIGAGPSGSGPQQPMTLDEEFRQLLHDYGNSEPHPKIRRRQLRNEEEPRQLIDTVAKQYYNLLSAYNELNTEFETSSTRVQNILMVRLHYMVITILFIYYNFILLHFYFSPILSIIIRNASRRRFWISTTRDAYRSRPFRLRTTTTNDCMYYFMEIKIYRICSN